MEGDLFPLMQSVEFDLDQNQFSEGLIKANVKAWGTYPVDKNRLITSKMQVLIKAKKNKKNLLWMV